MSAPTADAPRNAGALTIVGIALVLMILSALVAVLIASRGGVIDGAARLEAAFGVRTIGADYAIVEQRKMPGGAELIVFEDKSAPVESEMHVALAETAPAPKSVDAATSANSAASADPGESSVKHAETAASKAKDDRVDWSRVVIPSGTAQPRRVAFLFPAPGANHDLVADFFRDREGKSFADLGADGGKVVVGSGKLAWRGFDADWVQERAFEKGGTFRDGMRVDLSVEKSPCVMTTEWTRGAASSRAALDKLLDALGTK